MNSFVSAQLTTPYKTRTENGMVAQTSTMNALVDMFYNIGAMRGKDVIPTFVRAFNEDEELALRVALWARDVRGGAGERKIFRDILSYLEESHSHILINTKFLELVPELGRWDDLLVFNKNAIVITKAYGLIAEALNEGNGLCAKWMPRKGLIAVNLRRFMDWSPKQYRKTLVTLSDTVEQKMCAGEFNKIEYSHVPSLAMSRYMTAFHKRDTDRFVAFRMSLEKGETTVNAGAVYPYDIIKALRNNADASVCNAQWNALPDYMNEAKVLPMVDVSGSMTCGIGGKGNAWSGDTVTCLDVALSLGLYCADKNKGAFKDVFLTFSQNPKIQKVSGSLSDKMKQMERADWQMNTNLVAAFNRVLDVAVTANVPQEDMPEVVLILSDMQFDSCTRFDHSAMQMIEHKYSEAGYKMPSIVFWNLRAAGNAPVSYNKDGVALVSGCSPAIMKSVLSMDMSDMTPESLMKKAVLIDRYDYR